jgi:hypothetical protein
MKAELYVDPKTGKKCYDSPDEELLEKEVEDNLVIISPDIHVPTRREAIHLKYLRTKRGIK